MDPSIVENPSLIDNLGMTNVFSLNKNRSIVDDLGVTKKSTIEGRGSSALSALLFEC